MKKLVIMIGAIILSGCATPPTYKYMSESSLTKCGTYHILPGEEASKTFVKSHSDYFKRAMSTFRNEQGNQCLSYVDNPNYARYFLMVKGGVDSESGSYTDSVPIYKEVPSGNIDCTTSSFGISLRTSCTESTTSVLAGYDQVERFYYDEFSTLNLEIHEYNHQTGKSEKVASSYVRGDSADFYGSTHDLIYLGVTSLSGNKSMGGKVSLTELGLKGAALVKGDITYEQYKDPNFKLEDK